MCVETRPRYSSVKKTQRGQALGRRRPRGRGRARAQLRRQSPLRRRELFEQVLVLVRAANVRAKGRKIVLVSSKPSLFADGADRAARASLRRLVRRRDAHARGLAGTASREHRVSIRWDTSQLFESRWNVGLASNAPPPRAGSFFINDRESTVFQSELS